MTQPSSKKTIAKKSNGGIWKFLTFLLLGIILGGVGYISYLTTQKQEIPIVKSTPLTVPENLEILDVNTNKEKVNTLIDHYLKEYLTSDKISYEFYLENQALLKGTFKLLGYPMAFYLYFDPFVLEDGNIQLKAQSLSIGALGIPINEVLKYVKRYFEMPKWIEIKPKEGQIFIHLDELKLNGNLKIRAEKIDLVQDEIKFKLYFAEKDQKKIETEKKDDNK